MNPQQQPRACDYPQSEAQIDLLVRAYEVGFSLDSLPFEDWDSLAYFFNQVGEA
jgi:hypothetical protein